MCRHGRVITIDHNVGKFILQNFEAKQIRAQENIYSYARVDDHLYDRTPEKQVSGQDQF